MPKTKTKSTSPGSPATLSVNSFSCNAVHLDKALDLIRKQTFKPNNPVFENLYLRIFSDHILLVASDGSEHIRIVLPCRSNLPESTICGISLSVVTKFCAVCKQDVDIVFTFNDELSQLTIKHNMATIKVPTLLEMEGYYIPDIPTNVPNTLSPTKFIEELRTATFFLSTELSRGCLCGVNIKAIDNYIILSSTDGNRLFYHTVQLESTQAFQGNWTVSPRFADIFTLTKDVEFSLVFSDEAILVNFHLGEIGVVLYTRLLQGKYPNIASLLPKEGLIKVDVATQSFVSLIKLYLSTISEDSSPLISLTLSPGDDSITIRGLSRKGEFFSNVDALIEGLNEEFVIGLNARYILDVLQSPITTDIIRFELTDRFQPVLFYPQPNSKMLVMPVRLRD